MCGLRSPGDGGKAYKTEIMPMTPALGLSAFDESRRERLMQLCDVYAEALDIVLRWLSKNSDAEDDLGPLLPEIVN